MEKIADKLRESVEAAKRERKGQAILTQHEQEDIEKHTALLYAKENNLWIDNLYSLGKPTKVSGYENTLALDEVNDIVYKSNNLFNSGFLISNLLNQIRIHNILFPETKYELVGFTGIDNGENRPPHIEVIIKQDFVEDAVQASPQEITEFMLSLGFEKINGTTFTNGQYTVADLFPRNVLKDKNGVIYVVDNIVSENLTPETI